MQGGTLKETEHRPWPLPERSWFMGQTWCELLFAHWPVPPEALQRVMPPQLAPDVLDGSAWIGVTPFRVTRFRLRGTPPVPGLSSFDEINVRTYTTIDGRPGIYFLSLDAGSSLAVASARRTYRLPYFRARTRVDREGERIQYRSERVSPDGPPANFRASYGPAGPRLDGDFGSLPRWLAERYCLYVTDEEGAIQRADIHHPPWPLQPGWAEVEENTMARHVGLELEGEPLLHYSERQDTVIWRLRRV